MAKPFHDGGLPAPPLRPLLNGRKRVLAAVQVRRHVNQVGIDGEVGQAPAEGEQRLARVTVRPVLADGVLDVLAR